MRKTTSSARIACMTVVASLALGVGLDTAHAQERGFDISVFAGLRTFDKDGKLGAENLNDVKVVNSVIFGPRFQFKLASKLFLEAELPLLISKTSENQETLLVLFIHPRAQLMFAPMPESSFQPALLAGFGLASSDFIDNQEVVPQGHLGVGVRFPHRLKWNARLDFRYVIGQGRESGISNEFEVLLSVYRPEPKPKEDKPVGPVAVDTDQDGIVDREDKCPKEAEDEDDFEDEDGCPDSDNDGDGLKDSDDKCPIEPETKNNYKDDDGCPDEIPIEIKSFTGTIDGIQFELNSANLTRDSYPVLDEAVKVLKDFQDLEVVIVGHTDNQGTEEYNLDLSQRRAETVMRYLISRGIDDERLKAVGMGMAEPVTDNDTDAGRAQNRRVDFIIK